MLMYKRAHSLCSTGNELKCGEAGDWTLSWKMITRTLTAGGET